MRKETDATNATSIDDYEKLVCPFLKKECTRKCALFTPRGCSLRQLQELENIKEEFIRNGSDLDL